MPAVIPVTWDRFTEQTDGYYIYGWIQRTDKQRDFVLLEFWTNEDGLLQGTFVTSSAKYSAAIYKFLYHDEPGHTSCKLIKDFPADV